MDVIEALDAIARQLLLQTGGNQRLPIALSVINRHFLDTVRCGCE